MSAQKQHTFGLHAVTALLEKQPESINHLYIQKNRHDNKMAALLSVANKLQHIAIYYVSREELDNLSNTANHQGVIAISTKTHSYSEADLKNIVQNAQNNNDGPPLLLILDGVQDPHNLGACFRSADAAGAHALIVPRDKSVGLTPIVAKVACGAVESVPFVQVVNLTRTLKSLKDLGIWIFGADMEAQASLFQTDLSGPIALVLGGEGSGLRRLTREHCDNLIKIPMRGAISSLNVSVATGICLFEVIRQRKF